MQRGAKEVPRALRAQVPYSRFYPGQGHKVPPGMRVRHVAFAVSTFGSIGTDAQALLELVARSACDAVPRSLLSETSWSTSSFVRFARQAVT
jgi:hypothetical protein